MPDICENCTHCTVRDRLEDYGDVSMPYCPKHRAWLDLFEDRDAPCYGEDYEPADE